MPELDTSVPHEARVYDYLLGGKSNYGVDREAGDAILQVTPQMPVWAKQNRQFLKRAVRFVAGEGIDQFLDIGTGLPTVENTHEVALAANPAARVVYTDYDPMVLAHARVLLDAADSTAYLQHDLRQPDELIADARELLDFDRPIAVMLVAVLHHLRDEESPEVHVRRILDAVPAGSYLVLSHATYDFLTPSYAAELHEVLSHSPMTFRARSRDEVQDAFLTGGLDVVPPGLVATTEWRMDNGDIGTTPDTSQAGHWAAVARKTG
ncbi:SAM-dependent methyltransferase [Pseudonocardia lacus]|uniref:SAM-dependent methyltransferase n=1 Tax=Pseudonocardia lacus TaxID=2835865 RepID=UPI001BDCE952|nr:SAM-dependent methyltransferase [Pseudonocardia lacus]